MRRFWHEIEGKSWEEVQRIQLGYLQKELRYVHDRSSFYQEKFDRAKLRPEDIRHPNDLQKLPYTEKKELRASIAKYPPLGSHACVAVKDLVRVQSSSGTTGKPTYYGLTKNDVHMWNETTARVYYANTLMPGEDVVIHLFAMSKLFAGGVPMQDALDYMGLAHLPMGAEAGSSRILEAIHDCKITAFTGTPSFALHLAEEAKALIGIDARDLGVKKLALGGEPGVQIPGMREKIQEAWGDARAYDLMGMGDFGMLWAECGQQHGMHYVAQEFIMIQLLDPATGQLMDFKEGADGELIYTAIQREANPLINYRTGDRVQVIAMDCPCGRKGPVIRCVGRTDDMLIVKGINVFPTALRDVVLSFSPRTTGEMRIVLDKPEYSFSHAIRMKVEGGKGVPESALPGLGKEIEKNIKDKLNCTADIRMMPYGSLTIAMGNTMKTIYFENLWQK